MRAGRIYLYLKMMCGGNNNLQYKENIYNIILYICVAFEKALTDIKKSKYFK